MDITELRNEIDEIDEELVRLFCQRMSVSSKVAEYKKATGSPIHHPGREQEILNKVGRIAGPEMEYYVKALYCSIFELSRGYQRHCLGCTEVV